MDDGDDESDDCEDDNGEDDDGEDDNNDDEEADQAKIEGCSSVNGKSEGDVHVSPGVVASRAG